MVIEDLRELRAMRAGWQRLARTWALTGRELGELLPEAGEDLPSPPADTELRMRLMLAVAHRLPFREEEAEVRAWARLAIPELSWSTPLEVMSRGPAHMRELRRWAEWKFAS